MLLPPGAARAQDLRYLRHQSWSVEDGLPQDSVHQVLQTNDGYLWIATEGGVARFDGISFVTFHHTNEPAFLSDDTCCLARSRDSDLWVGTAEGLLRLHGGRFSRVELPGGGPLSVKALATQPDGSPLILAASGLLQWRDDRLQPILNAPTGIRSLSATDRGVWLLRDGDTVLWRDGHPVPSPPLPHAEPILTLADAPDGTHWTASNTTVTHGPASWRVGAQLPGSRIESLTVDRHGVAWIGTNDGLVAVTTGQATATPVPSLRGNAILQTLEDREGNLWVATETSGLHLLRPSKFRTEPQLADRPLTSVIQATDGALWLGTRTDGLRRLRGQVLDEPARADALTSSVILSLAPGPDGSVWAGTPDGLNRIAPDGTVQHITSADGLPDDYIQVLLTAPDGSLWIGTRQGLVHLERGHMDVLTRHNGLSGDLVGSLLLTRANDLWIATSGGLSRRDAHGIFTSLPNPPGGIVSAMAEDPSGSLWIATQSGQLSRLAHGHLQPLAHVTLPAPVTGLIADTHGYLWIRDRAGVARVALADLNAGSLPIRHYGLADGMPSTEIAGGGSPTLWRTASGELWTPTRRGVAIVDPEHLPSNTAPPLIALEHLLVDQLPWPIDGNPVEIPPGHVRYTMDYAALSYTAPAEVRYRFLLEGLDKSWTEAGTRRTATYTNLPPGRYRFRIQAANNDGVWSEATTSLRIRVLSPIYRRWWFVLLALAALIGLSVWLYRLRLKRLRARFDSVLAERNRVAREIHDTLAQDFVGVSLQLDIVAQLLRQQKIDPALQQVSETRSLVTEGLANARRSIWELRANLSADSLPTRLGAAVQRHQDSPITLRLKIGGAYRVLDPAVEAEVLRIAQESLSNVQRHSGATEASVDLRYGGDTLVLTIEDNGRGFSVDQALAAEGHYGLRGIRERSAVLHGDLEIQSQPGEGTRVILRTPITGRESIT
jgi:signal transduction histidine kinase/ligand-binding sensor domain-containing protein